MNLDKEEARKLESLNVCRSRRKVESKFDWKVESKFDWNKYPYLSYIISIKIDLQIYVTSIFLVYFWEYASYFALRALQERTYLWNSDHEK